AFAYAVAFDFGYWAALDQAIFFLMTLSDHVNSALNQLPILIIVLMLVYLVCGLAALLLKSMPAKVKGSHRPLRWPLLLLLAALIAGVCFYSFVTEEAVLIIFFCACLLVVLLLAASSGFSGIGHSRGAKVAFVVASAMLIAFITGAIS